MFDYSLRQSSKSVSRQPLVLWAIAFATTAGTAVEAGLWIDIIHFTLPLWTLPFVFGCLLATGGASVALLSQGMGYNWPFLNAIASVVTLKYGVWTLMFWVRQWASTTSVEPGDLVLFIVHVGLLVQGLLLVPWIRSLHLWPRLGILGWLVLGLYVDYGLGFHPPLPPAVPVDYVFGVAVVLTVLLSLGLVLLPHTPRRRMQRPIVM
jgi:uncharacterized membrane protein YpjA